MEHYGPLKNNLRHKKIFIKIGDSIGYLGKIQTLSEGGICFFPIKLTDLFFLGNNNIYNWPLKPNHITFHNSGRVHIGKKIVFDYGKHNEDKNIVGQEKRESIGNHKPQSLFKLKIPSFDFLEQSNYKKEDGDITLEWNNINQELFFTCGIFDGKSLIDALQTGNDPFGLVDIGNYLNDCMIGLGNFSDVTKNELDGTKILFLRIRDYEKGEKFTSYPYIFSVSEYNKLGTTPY